MVENAKQFMPFDSLKGFREVLEKKEIVKENRKILTDSSTEMLENEFKKLNIGSSVQITHYYNDQYIVTRGQVTKIDYVNKQIILNNDTKINVINIIDIIS